MIAETKNEETSGVKSEEYSEDETNELVANIKKEAPILWSSLCFHWIPACSSRNPNKKKVITDSMEKETSDAECVEYSEKEIDELISNIKKEAPILWSSLCLHWIPACSSRNPNKKKMIAETKNEETSGVKSEEYSEDETNELVAKLKKKAPMLWWMNPLRGNPTPMKNAEVDEKCTCLGFRAIESTKDEGVVYIFRGDDCFAKYFVESHEFIVKKIGWISYGLPPIGLRKTKSKPEFCRTIMTTKESFCDDIMKASEPLVICGEA